MIEFNERNAKAWSMVGTSGALGIAATEIAAGDPDFAVVTSDLCFFSGLERFRQAHPERLFNVGIAEQNMVGVAAGMVKEGMHVFATTYATFATTRGLDQVKVNMGYMKLPVKLIGLTSGYAVGILGATHMALEDMAIMRSVPNMTVLSPCDCMETIKCLLAAAQTNEPTYIRLSGTQRIPIIYREDYPFEIGKAVVLRKGDGPVLFATGSMVSCALQIADGLAEEGVNCEVVNIHTLKPIDQERILSYKDRGLVVTLEEHSVIGGLGGAVAEVFAAEQTSPRQLTVGVEDFYPHAGSYEFLMEESGLIAEKIIPRIKECLRD